MKTHRELRVNVVSSRICYLLVFISLSCYLAPSAQGEATTKSPSRKRPTIVWEKHFGQKGIFYHSRSTAVTDNGELLLATTGSSLKEGLSTGNILSLWHLDSTGEIKKRIDFSKTIGELNKKLVGLKSASFTSIAVSKNRESKEVAFLLQLPPERIGSTERYFLLLSNEEGQILSMERIEQLPHGSALKKIIPLEKNNFLLVGNLSFDFLLTKINRKGEILWNKKYDRSKWDDLQNGFVTVDGHFVIAGCTGNELIAGKGPSKTWVGKFDLNGNLKAERVFPGVFGGIAKTSLDIFSLTYDEESSFQERDIHVEAFDSNLAKLWNAEIINENVNNSRSNIVQLADSGFLVVGGKEKNILSLTKIDLQGKTTWSYKDGSMQASGKYETAATTKEAFIVSSIVVKHPLDGINIKLRVIKFAQANSS